jgi:hypothetical protein
MVAAGKARKPGSTGWPDASGCCPVTDADVEAALDAAGQWPGTEQARRLIEGTVALIATAPGSGSQLQTGVSAQNLRRLGVVIPAIPRGSQLAAASRSEQPHLPRLRVSGDAPKLGAGDLAFDTAGAEQLFCLPHAAARPETAADPVRPAPTARPGIRSCAAHARHRGSAAPAPAPSSRRRRCLAAARPRPGTELAGEASASNTGRATGRTASSALATSPSRTFESLSCSSNDTQATAWPLRSAHCTSSVVFP